MNLDFSRRDQHGESDIVDHGKGLAGRSVVV